MGLGVAARKAQPSLIQRLLTHRKHSANVPPTSARESVGQSGHESASLTYSTPIGSSSALSDSMQSLPHRERSTRITGAERETLSRSGRMVAAAVSAASCSVSSSTRIGAYSSAYAGTASSSSSVHHSSVSSSRGGGPQARGSDRGSLLSVVSTAESETASGYHTPVSILVPHTPRASIVARPRSSQDCPDAK